MVLIFGVTPLYCHGSDPIYQLQRGRPTSTVQGTVGGAGYRVVLRTPSAAPVIGLLRQRRTARHVRASPPNTVVRYIFNGGIFRAYNLVIPNWGPGSDT